MNMYLTVGARDPAVSNAFYDATMPTIGWAMHREYPDWRVYSEGGAGKGLVISIGLPFDGQPATAGNGSMIGFFVNTHSEVLAFYNAAVSYGGSGEGLPGFRPGYGDNWYAAYVRDPTGNKLAAVCNR